MLEEMPTVELRGEEYDLEPLGIADIFKAKKLIEKIGKNVGEKLETDSINLMNLDQASQAVQMKVMFVAIDVAEQELYKLLSMITGLDEETLQNKEKVPADAPIKILQTFWNEHPDIKEYKKAMGNIGAKKQAKKQD